MSSPKLLKFKDRIVNLIWLNVRKDDSLESEEEFEEFLNNYEQRTKRIKQLYPNRTNLDINNIALSLENAYNQKQISEANKGLKVATWILAFATIAFTIATIWGASTAGSIVTGIFRVLVVIVAILVLFWLALTILAFIIRILFFRSPHIICSKCNRIIFEYEREGDKKPAFTTCPECSKE
jgi:hypothetical protein